MTANDKVPFELILWAAMCPEVGVSLPSAPMIESNRGDI